MAMKNKHYPSFSKYEIYFEVVLEKKYTIVADKQEDAIEEAKKKVLCDYHLTNKTTKIMDMELTDAVKVRGPYCMLKRINK